ncbi:conserved Plasmodium protein, unknown function [Plasmodium vivax]|uniref:Uncharacterized protein n=6 Tax=Plasmodium vivax TaxID=5855 RepID=A5K0X0_PLAVS|nr:hypothetical protein, conserved [Plasmodium vivax]KMZ78570.1 hypothetical protein PVIIG_01347 [Plasmodium vivax India VII]KMZ83757.1 hypothetical protein PVBG_00837 [Plasmodium vivax Brazil I]KMZ90959.1 hypothetical protein PVMG_04148 [Plasmodium vivax Mauritania I]KMZ97502.1 hypothetical protein PVNG_03936 [Plasmodium vivax North Korean]EDL46967.1 hypothetical protein, conserved [Plasmodium vivax]|eukprot:XP_001616694.1 hypothetical protein [Plasmodium vivax Sal-1]
MESFNIGKNAHVDFLEPAITISVIFICLYMIISTDNPAHFLIRSFFFKSKIFLWEVKDIFTHINLFALTFSSFFFVSYYILHVLKYERVRSLFSVNYDYYEKILNYNLKDVNIKSLFQNGISEKNYLVNLVYSFKFFFNIFFLNDASLTQTVFTSFFVFVLLSLYAKRVSRAVFIISTLTSAVLSGFVLVFFLKKFLNVEYDQCGEEIFSFLFLIFFYITNPYLSVFQYNDRSLHPYHGTELRLYIHLLFFVRYVTYEGTFYEVKALVAVIICAIVFLRQAMESFEVHTFAKLIWLAAYYFVNNYVPFAFSGNFTLSKLFDSGVVELLRNEFKNNISLHHFNVLSKIPFNYLVSKISFFWIPYMLLTRTNKNLKYLIMLLMSINMIATSTYLAKNVFPGIPLNMLLLFCLNKIGI